MTALLLDVAPYPVFPPTRGGAIAIHHANLAVSAFLRVQLVSQGLRRDERRHALGGGFSFQHTPSYREDRLFSLPSLVVGYLSGQRGGGSMLSADRTLRLTRSNFIRRAIEEADLVQVEHPWQVPIIAHWNNGRRPLVLVAHNVEASVAEQTGRPPREVEAIRRREAEAVAASDAVIVFTDDDRARLCEFAGADPKKFHVIPLGVDADRIRPASPDEKARAKASLGLEKKRLILFVGSLYGPNIEAAREVFRIAEASDRRNVLFVIAGRVGEKFRSTDRVLVTGEASDIAPYFAAADVAINPMKSGGGMQVKLLEFLAAGVPTITTPIGVRGVGAVSGRECVVAEIAGFADAITELLNDESAATGLGQAGRRLVEGRYAWSAIGLARVDLYQRLLSQSRPA